MTFQDLIDSSFRLIGELSAAGETMNTDEYNDALVTLNQLLSSLSAEQIVIPQVVHDTFPLTGTASYTFGLTGVFNTARPLRLISVASIDVSGSSHPVRIVDAVEWAGILDKTRVGLYAEVVHDDGAYPLRKLYLSPKPAAGSLYILSDKPLTAAATLATNVDLPSGFERMLRSNLAVDLAGEYGRPVEPSVLNMARESKAAVANLNRQALGALGASAAPPPAVPPGQAA